MRSTGGRLVVDEVEVTKPDGDTVDVLLDENCDVVVIEGDSEGSGSE